MSPGDSDVLKKAQAALTAKYLGRQGITGVGRGLCTGADGIARMGVVINTDGTRLKDAPTRWDVTDTAGRLLGSVPVRVKNTGVAHACSQFWQKVSGFFARYWPFQSFGRA